MRPTFLARVQQTVDVQHAGVGLVVLGWIRIRDVVGRVHLLCKRPRSVCRVPLVRDERQERPESAPLAHETIVVIALEVGRDPRYAEAVRVVVVGAGERIVLDGERERIPRSAAALACATQQAAQNESTAAQPIFHTHVHDISPRFGKWWVFTMRAAVQPRRRVSRVTLWRATLNQAAYSAGTKKIVSNVAIVRPPMIAMAIGPQNTLRVIGTIANTVAAAVSTTGRVRCTAASRTAFHASRPAAISVCT